MLIVDAHLDLAFNASRGRDPRQPAAQQPVVDGEIATVGLPDLLEGNVGLICATIFCEPASPTSPHGYTNAEGARAQALSQWTWYQSCEQDGLLEFVRSPDQLPRDTGVPPVRVDLNAPIPSGSESTKHGRDARVTTKAILLLEGADALRTPDDLDEWHKQGLRIVGLSWKRTRFAGGTGAPGPLTAEGRELVKHLDRFKMIHDTSHLAEESFWNLMDLTTGPVIASHSNCRAIVGGGDRHLTDEMIKEIGKRSGVIGINFFDKFLVPQDQYGKRRATLADVVDHMKRICDLTGSANHVAIGTDMDGGLGLEQIPEEIHTSEDLIRIAEALKSANFSDSDVLGIMGSNWLRFFARTLPGA